MGEKVIFNRQGAAKAFLLDGTFYDYEGQPIAFLYDDNFVVSYTGKHLGWFYNGYIRDFKGDAVGYAIGARLGPVTPADAGKPPRMPSKLGTPPARVEPKETEETGVLSYAWSADTLEHFFSNGRGR